MSDKAQDPKVAALQTITRDVYLPAFVEKCASAGIRFPDDESLNAALESVAMLKAAEEAESVDLAKQARADLGKLLGESKPDTEDEIQKSASVASTKSVIEALRVLAAGQ